MSSPNDIEALRLRIAQLEKELALLKNNSKISLHGSKTVNVPEPFQAIFDKAQNTVRDYFSEVSFNPNEGSIDISGQRYVLVRASAFSYEFLNRIKSLYSDRGENEATAIGKSFQFDIAHVIGYEDANNFHDVMKLEDPIEKLSAGPVHFAYSGWAFVDILSESSPSPDENFYLMYNHPYSFEADSWIKAGKKSDSPVCMMNAGYSSGWCEASFGIDLTAVEITCRACGDENCTFIMAPPHKIKDYLTSDVYTRYPEGQFDVPLFFERKSTEENTRKSLKEKEILLKEIHHRVKNNLQIISSLLKLQAEFSEENDIQKVIHDSQTRIKTMALVHERLYQSNVESVNLGYYVKSIADLTMDSYADANQKIKIDINSSNQGLSLKIDLAISLGLLINEVITNAIKYAFTDNPSDNRITITIDSDDNAKIIHLKISDNGRGLPKDFSIENSGTFGMELIQLLVNQIDAEFNCSSNGGAHFEFKFNYL